MIWLDILIAIVIASVAAFGTSFLSSAWKRLRKNDPSTQAIFSLLPGYDCGLCGKTDCRSFAAWIDKEGGDPARCVPGGSRVEALIRTALKDRPGYNSLEARRAAVRCGGFKAVAREDFAYDGRMDCATAMRLYGGSKSCKDGCLGLGSCASVCPVHAIKIVDGLAVVNPAYCTGCGRCQSACPRNVIDMIPRDQAWYVACSARRDPESRIAACSAACNACGSCAQHSMHREFSLSEGLARENPEAANGTWERIAGNCPQKCIVLAGKEKNR